MKIHQKITTVIVFVLLFIGCSTTGHVKEDSVGSPDTEGSKTVSVSAFTCPDPLMARDVQNAIIGSLLESYTVTTDAGAGIVINGDIILSYQHNISEIKATVIKNRKTAEAITLTSTEAALSSDASPEAMGRKMGNKIREILSR